MSKVKPVKLLCAIDIEALGRSNSSIPFSIGFCYGTNWTDRTKVRISILPDEYHTYHEKYGTKVQLDNKQPYTGYIKDICEPSTWNEFWSKNTNVLEKLLSEALPTGLGFKLLSETISSIYEQEAKSKGKLRVVFIGDNPAYDFSHLNAALEKYCDELPIRYSNRTKLSTMRKLHAESKELPVDGYHGISDPSERVEFFDKAEEFKNIVAAHSNHSHMPDDDAEGIYLQYLLLKDDKFFDTMDDLTNIVNLYETMAKGSDDKIVPVHLEKNKYSKESVDWIKNKLTALNLEREYVVKYV